MDPKTGLYSKAAKLIRSLPQERGTAEQMIAAARKAGLKQAELDNLRAMPSGPTTREDLARLFENSLPKLRIDQYGENQRYSSNFATPPNVVMRDTYDGEDEQPEDPKYQDYAMPGGKNYRERLLRLVPDASAEEFYRTLQRYRDLVPKDERDYGPDHHITNATRARLAELEAQAASASHGRPLQGTYQSSHWTDHPNVLAHLRLQDRETPGGKRLLHVDELQSDWAQQGRDQGFNSGKAKQEREALHQEINDALRAKFHADLPDNPERAEWMANYYAPHIETGAGLLGRDYLMRLAQNDEAIRKEQLAPPAAPYVQNTQHWTDLALKNVLREAALGNYDGIVFTPGQAQADRYGLDKHIDMLKYQPSTGLLVGTKQNAPVVKKLDVKREDLPSLIGKDMTERLLHPDNTFDAGNGNIIHRLEGDDLKMGGQGMRGYYDQIVPKSVMRLAQMHDPDVKPGEPISLEGETGETYQGFHLPMTDKLRQGILNEGFPAMRRGGSVDAALALTRGFSKRR